MTAPTIGTITFVCTFGCALGAAYLRDALRTRLSSGEATFDFLIQFQTDSRRTPIEDATVEWKEADSPYHRVATIRIPTQQLEDAAREARCEQMAYNPWH